MTRNIGTNANILQLRMQEQPTIPTGAVVGYGFLYEGQDQQLHFVNASGTGKIREEAKYRFCVQELPI